jgi:uncharacterized membrane protein HdeD (DUF308 family)
MGAGLIVIGLLALAATRKAGLLSIVLLGIVLIGSGLVEVASGLGERTARNSLPHLLGGILTVVVGALLAFGTRIGLAGVTLFMAGYFLISGAFWALTSLLERYQYWASDFLFGLFCLALGLLVVANWRRTSLWLVGMLVGLEILFHGISMVLGALGLRHDQLSQRPASPSPAR